MLLRFRKHAVRALLLALSGLSLHAWADGPPAFDLTGPKLSVTVARADKSLPIAQVPNLAAGDVLSVKADLPVGQSARYLLVAAFLRGATNPPPEQWFFKSETWKDAAGLTLRVPEGAQQVLIFLAPQTGGDFKTLVNAVRGKPGAFVRASQDLNQASLDRSRLDAYLAEIKQATAHDPDSLKEIASVLGRSLAIKIDSKCFDKPTEEQAPCLLQNQDAIILSDGHSTSIVQALTSGPAGDLATQVSYTPQAAYGAYSPYVASLIDIARILDSLHTAQYQYIPALAKLNGDTMELMLNTPPSFHNPKSVLVIALPAVEQSQPPPLRAATPKQDYCAQKELTALNVEGAPLVFSTEYSHGNFLRVKTRDGKDVDIPVKADAARGGLLLSAKEMKTEELTSKSEGTLHGQWGFESYTGPVFQLESDTGSRWQLASGDHQSVVVGRDDVVHLQAGDAACLESIRLLGLKDAAQTLEWKTVNPNEVEVTVPLNGARPGDLSMEVKQYGEVKPQTIALRAFGEAGHLDGFTFYAGDDHGVLKGTRLAEATKLVLKGQEFVPGKLNEGKGDEELIMQASDARAVAALTAGEAAKAEVTLNDGRVIDLDVTVKAGRPSVVLIGKNIEPTDPATGIDLTSADELPESASVIFSVRAQKPVAFPHDAAIDVATQDEAVMTRLSVKDGGLTLQSRNVAVARLNPAKALGESAFGPLKFRIAERDTTGDWQPLATLIRLPKLRRFNCPSAPAANCTLSGEDLFLIDSLASDAAFTQPIQVPDGFTGTELSVPRSANGRLFLKLRDDPTVVNHVTLQNDAASDAVQTPAQSRSTESHTTSLQ